jgi:F-type H+-transporting ATPase subunit a
MTVPDRSKKSLSAAKNAFFALFLGLVSSAFLPVFGQEEHPKTEEHPVQEKKVSRVILEHVMDSHKWHFFEGHYGTLFLPVIVYTPDRGLEIFSSRKFFDDHHQEIEYNGFRLDHNKIYRGESQVLDFSITKNVMMLFINAALLLIVLTSVARGYKRNKGKAPKGTQSFIEPIVLFVKDEIVRPNIGPKYEKYLPYLLTLFFFILFGNILGLLPGSANLTGNIAVTLTLAICTFVITNLSGNKNYWKHIFWTPGVPLPLRVLIMPVEIIGVFTKPFSLMIRLFAAITAGHIVLLSLLGLTFIYHSWFVGVGSTIFVLFITLIEILVAGIQAYVFTLFTSLYIGMAIEEHDHGHDH